MAALSARPVPGRCSLQSGIARIPWDAAINYSFAKEQQLTLEQDGAWLKSNIPDFLKGMFKPGLGGHEQVARKKGKAPGAKAA